MKRAVLCLLAVATVGLLGPGTWAALTLPDPGAIEPSTVVIDREGRILRAFLSPEQTWRLPADVDRLDPGFVKMLLAIEDRRFENHPGIDPLAIGRAALQALTAGRIVSGASTITMQTVRLLDPRQRTLAAKLIEMARALTLEFRLTKREILELYLTLAPYGGNLQGIRAASLAYFGKEPDYLKPSEAALLVAIPQAPEARRPDRHPEAARRARDRILERAGATGTVGLDEIRAAVADAIPTARQLMPFSAPHLARRLAAAGYRRTIATTIDGTLQDRLESMARRWVEHMPPHTNLSVVVADAGSGAVRAHLGSAGFFDAPRAGQIDLSRAVRSPGSTLKPLVYAMAIEDEIVDPRSVILDAPHRVAGYAPANFSASYLGEITATEALQQSLNQPAVQLLERVGAGRFVGRLERAGLAPVLPWGAERPGLAVVLGGLGTSLENLVSLYTAFATDGRVRPLVVLRDNEEASPLPLLAAGSAWEVRRILAGTPQPNQGRSRIAWKTGTSYGYRDAWAVGIIDGFVVGVWAGRPDGTPRPGHFGRNTAAPLLFDAAALLPATAHLTDPPPPEGWTPIDRRPLPPALKFFQPRPVGRPADPDRLRIASPLGGAQLSLAGDLGITLAAQGGRRPLTWLIDSVPLPSPRHRRDAYWQPEGPGFAEIVVLDATGRVARSRIEVVNAALQD